MPSSCTFPGADGLIRHMRELAGMRKSRQFANSRQRIKGFVDVDYKTNLLAGIDSQGRRVPDAEGIKARRKGKYKGKTGEPGTPSGKASRMYAAYSSRWTEAGNSVFELTRTIAWGPARFLLKRFRYAGIRSATYAKVRRELRALAEWYTDPANRGKGA